MVRSSSALVAGLRSLRPHRALVHLVLQAALANASLRFGPEGTFKILQFADLHYGGLQEDDAATDRLQAQLLAAEQPDLVVLSGDMVSGYLWNESLGSGWFKDRWTQLMAPIRQSNLPHLRWASTLGNHDGEADLDPEVIVKLDQASGPGSLTQQGPGDIEGVTNYHLDISSAHHSQPAARIWLLDSRDFGCAGQPGWGCVGPSTVSWFTEQAHMLPHPLLSLAFIHIPLAEFTTAWNEGSVKGSKAEPVNCPSGNSRAFDALKTANVTAVFSGHDHDNNFDAMHPEGVRLVYGHKTGYGSYGPPAGWGRGARVIVLQEGQNPAEAESWIRLENGSRIVQSPAHPHQLAEQRQEACDASTAYCFHHTISERRCKQHSLTDHAGGTDAHEEL